MLGFAAVVLSAVSLIGLLPQAWFQSSFLTTLTTATEDLDATAILDASLVGVLAVLPSAMLVSLAMVVLNALLVVAVSTAVLGRKTSPRELWQKVRHRVPAAVGLSLLSGLIVGVSVMGVFAVLLVPGAVLFTNDHVWLGFLLVAVGLLAAVVVAILLSVKLSLAGPALLLEELPVVQSLRRSWRLIAGSFWRVFLVLLVMSIITYITSMLIQTPFNLIGMFAGIAMGDPAQHTFGLALVSTTVNAIGTTVSGAILTPWSAAVIALLYIDLRMRREGLDIELGRAAETGGAE
jgi:hypothetical protein